MKFLLTYGAIDGEYGNPFWHSFVILSTLKEGEKIEVVDNWGFYGIPSTERDTYLSQLKIKLGLDVDLKGNHGMLRHEDVRYLDTGSGLHGITFEITEEKFKLLKEKCQTMMHEQDAAIKEVVETNHLEKPEGKFRIYPYEKYSTIIYALEKIKAKKENRESRLKPFEFSIAPAGRMGLTLNDSHTCKSQFLSLLEGILTPDQLDRLSEHGKHKAIPKYSGSLETIHLHSSGPLREHKKTQKTKKSCLSSWKKNTTTLSNVQEILYYRDLADTTVKLHWTIPPQELAIDDQTTVNLLKIDSEYCDDAKNLIRQLQKIEWLFINAVIDEKYKNHQQKLIEHIRTHYEAFSIPIPPIAEKQITGWLSYALWAISEPKNDKEKQLLQKIEAGRDLITKLDLSICCDWKIDDEDVEGSPLEAVAAHLTMTDQKKLCKIIGRTYLTPDANRAGDTIQSKLKTA